MQVEIDIPAPFEELFAPSKQWRPIPGFEGKYEANKNGQIRSLMTNKVLKPAVNQNGYAHLSLCGKDHRVHRIIAKTFIPNPQGLRDVNHKNGIKTDNRAENLEWVSHSENEIHKIYALRTPGKLLKPMRRVQCLENGKVYESISTACRDLKIKTNHIGEACTGKISQTCGYHWRYV